MMILPNFEDNCGVGSGVHAFTPTSNILSRKNHYHHPSQGNLQHKDYNHVFDPILNKSSSSRSTVSALQASTKSSSSSSSSSETQGTRMVNDLKGKLSWKIKPEKSANIYMNPATEKIAQITVSWEPDAARTILEMAQEREQEFQQQQQQQLEDGKLQQRRRPLLVGVVGIPGSGKSTSCEILQEILPNSMVMPMDGYHYPLDKLQSMENPKDMVYRRGAPDTFDPDALYEDLTQILEGDKERVHIPGFDHAVGDPTPDQHTFDRNQHNIVICEGIYLLHNGDGWDKVKDLLDYSIYIEVDIDVCVERLKERNKCIPGYTDEEIEVRCEVVDRKNAETALHSQTYASRSVKSGAIGVVDECDVIED